MNSSFDPYYKWLAIPPSEQPPDHYRLLGVQRFEPNPEVISQSADRQMAFVQSFKTGAHSAESQKLLNELSTARVCLTNPAKKAAYDADLRAASAPPAPVAAAPVPVAPVAVSYLAPPVAAPEPMLPVSPVSDPFLGALAPVAAPIQPAARPASPWPMPMVAGAVFGVVVGLGAAVALSGSPARAKPTAVSEPLATSDATAPAASTTETVQVASVEATRPEPATPASTRDAQPRFTVPANTTREEAAPPGAPMPPAMTEATVEPAPRPEATSPRIYEQQREAIVFSGPERRLLGKDEGLCTLAGVTGGFAGDRERLWTRVRGDDWVSGGVTEQKSLGADVGVLRFPTSDYEFKEHVWSRGSPPLELISASEGICLLSGLGGGFLGFRESARLDVDDDGRWQLLVDGEQQTSVVVTEVKIPDWQGRVSFRSWHHGGPPVDLIAADEGFCFLAGIMGKYRTADQFTRLSIENGRWTLTGNEVREATYDTQSIGTGAVACVVRTKEPATRTALDARSASETPTDPAEATDLAESLWQQADRAGDAVAREADKRRAAELFRSALVNLSGRERKQVRDRLQEFEKEYPSFPIGKWSAVAPFIDLRANAIRGDWEQEGDAFANTATWSCVAVPLIPTGSYEVRAKIKRLEGNDTVFLGLPVGSTHIRVALSSNHGLRHCLIDGEGMEIEGKGFSHSPGLLENNREYLVHCEVTIKGGDAVVEVSLDGTRLMRWRGPIASVKPAMGKYHSVRCLRFEVASALAVYRDVELCVRSGDVRFDVY